MANPRIARARLIIALTLVVDAGFWIAFGVHEAKPAADIPFDPSPLGWGFACSAPFIAALLVLLSGPGIQRSLFARVLAWLVAFMPTIFLVLLVGFRPSRSDDPLWPVMLAAVGQMLIPASVRWAQDEGGDSFAKHFFRASAILIGLLVIAYWRVATARG